MIEKTTNRRIVTVQDQLFLSSETKTVGPCTILGPKAEDPTVRSLIMAVLDPDSPDDISFFFEYRGSDHKITPAEEIEKPLSEYKLLGRIGCITVSYCEDKKVYKVKFVFITTASGEDCPTFRTITVSALVPE